MCIRDSLGQKVTSIVPEGFAERLIADDLRSAEDALAQQIGTGIELYGRRKDGSDFPIEIMLLSLIHIFRSAYGPKFSANLEKLMDALPDGRARAAATREQMKAIRAQLAEKQAKAAQS